MPWTIYRYILGELLRTIALTAGVLVTVIAFGATIKPLAAGLLAPNDVARYVVLAVVPMLQFALPFAAGFGATLVLHRMRGDNEVLACAVGGLSYRRILTPVFGLGLGLSVVLLLLVHLVIPHFWVLMQRIATRDATRMLELAVANREAFTVGDVQIFADELYVIPVEEILFSDPSAQRPRTRLLLRGVLALKIGQDGEIEEEVSTSAALLDFYERAGGTELSLAAHENMRYSGPENTLSWTPKYATGQPLTLADNFKDNPKFMSLPRLLEIDQNPDLYVSVDRRNEELALVLQDRETLELIERSIESDHRVTLRVRDSSVALEYLIEAERFRAGVITRAGAGTVRVTESIDGAPSRYLQCDRVELSVVSSSRTGAVLKAELSKCQIRYADDLADRPPVIRDREPVDGLVVSGLDSARLFALGHRELLDLAATGVQSAALNRAVDDLAEELDDTHAEIVGRVGSRTALAATGLLLLLLGATLAIRLADALPLVIYLIAFLPSIADILLISGGEQIIRDQQYTAGTIVMWSGNVLLALLSLVAYLRLARN